MSSQKSNDNVHEIISVAEGSPAHKAGLRPHDKLVTINGEPVLDQVDYAALTSEPAFNVTVESNGVLKTVRVRRSYGKPIGITFGDDMRITPKRCRNKCVFCFVDQNKPCLRESLYVKDDDWRMSLMMGNYVTLTNLTDSEWHRLLRRKASPIYISVHTLNESLRAVMLGVTRGADIRQKLDDLKRHGLKFHSQIVMCPGYNDYAELEDTLRGLAEYHPSALSVAVVPVGLTKFREGLAVLREVDEGIARDTVAIVERFQCECLAKFGARFAYASDEFYVKARLPVPSDEAYEDYAQIENGVGLLRRFKVEFDIAMEELIQDDIQNNIIQNNIQSNKLNKHASCPVIYNEETRLTTRHVVLATGVDAAPFMRELLPKDGFNGVRVDVMAIENTFFGSSITVAGLLTGSDFVRALKDVECDEILIPACAINGDGLFLDGYTLDRLRAELKPPITPVGNTGFDLFRALVGR